MFVPRLASILSLSGSRVNAWRLFQIAGEVLEESSGDDSGRFGAQNAAAERDDLNSSGSSLFQLVIRPAAF
jgi:hypothetical protein